MTSSSMSTRRRLSRLAHGVPRRRVAAVTPSVVAALVGVALVTAPALVVGAPARGLDADPVPVSVVTTGQTPRSVDDFTFSSFDADYTLGRDDSGASTLDAIETLVAEFPETDQNKGIRRAIPTDYDGHPTDLDIVSVTDGEGRERDFETDTDDGFEVVTIAAEDYVHGSQTYVINYRQKNITRSFADTGVDEFYRDINGTAWPQPFETVSATLRLTGDLASAATGDAACYRGVYGAADPCILDAALGGGYSVGETGIEPYENVTIAVGFRPGTFAPWDPSFAASGLVPVFVAGLLALLLAFGAAIVARRTVSADAPGRLTIVAEFEPPREPELAMVGAMLHRRAKMLPAVLVSFAVRRIARIVETDKTYSLQYAGEEMRSRDGVARGLAPVENRIAHAFFGREFTPGETASLSTPTAQTTEKVATATKGMEADVITQGYRRPAPKAPLLVVGPLAVIAVGALGVTGVGLIGQERAGWIAALSLVLAVTAVTVPLLVFRQPLTAAGAELRDHVEGVRLYLQVAEEERIRVLQSVSGAERVDVDGAQVVAIYERLLPWAVLLGVDKSWSRVLGAAYERTGQEPEWFAGTNGFSIAAFTSGIGSMSSSTASFAGGSSGSSSSYGGSTGGGFSGGGSGGGGGGGV